MGKAFSLRNAKLRGFIDINQCNNPSFSFNLSRFAFSDRNAGKGRAQGPGRPGKDPHARQRPGAEDLMGDAATAGLAAGAAASCPAKKVLPAKLANPRRFSSTWRVFLPGFRQEALQGASPLPDGTLSGALSGRQPSPPARPSIRPRRNVAFWLRATPGVIR